MVEITLSCICGLSWIQNDSGRVDVMESNPIIRAISSAKHGQSEMSAKRQSGTVTASFFELKTNPSFSNSWI